MHKYEWLPRCKSNLLMADCLRRSTRSHALLKRIEIVNYGVLGNCLDVEGRIIVVAPDPAESRECVFVDPAGLQFIKPV